MRMNELLSKKICKEKGNKIDSEKGEKEKEVVSFELYTNACKIGCILRCAN